MAMNLPWAMNQEAWEAFKVSPKRFINLEPCFHCGGDGTMFMPLLRRARRAYRWSIY